MSSGHDVELLNRVKIAVLNQFAGQNTTADEIQRLLLQAPFERLRLLMAFCRGPGIGLLSRELAEFLERGGRAEAIIGLDMNGTSPEALEALIDMGVVVHLFGVKGDRTFHPKVCIFDDGRGQRYSALIGSANWTPGGLDSNFETGMRIDLRTTSAADRAVARELEELWSTYRRPAPPMGPGHLKRATRRLVRRLAEQLPDERRPAPDQRTTRIAQEMFGSLSAPRRLMYRPRRSRSRREQRPSVSGAQLPVTLYLHVTGPETGQGREIQVPLESLEDFFGVSRDDVYYMTFKHADGSEEANRPLAFYDNSTFRISSSKFREVTTAQRPMIVRLDRVGPDTFQVAIIRNGQRGYATALRRCDRGGRRSKRWGVA
jgi:HKD family nuclease